MPNLILLGSDLSTYTLSATSTDSSYPLTNLQTYFASDTWKSASVAANQTLVIDFGVSTACDFIVLENYASGNADSVVLEADTVSNFASATTVISAGTIDPSLTPSPNPAYFTFSSVSRRYWRLKYNLSAGSLAAVPYVGNWFLGAKMDFGYSYDYPYKSKDKKYETVEKVALDGRIRTAQPYAGRQMFEVKLSLLNDATKTNFQTFVSKVRGKLRPFYISDVDNAVYYVHFDGDYMAMDTIRYQLNNVPIKLKAQLVS